MPSVNIEASHLKRAVAAIKPVIMSRTTIPIMICAKITVSGGNMVMEGSDLDRSVQITVPADGEAAWCIDFGKLSAFTSIVPDGGLVRIDGENTVTIKCGKLTARIGSLPVEDFPTLSGADGGDSFTMPVKDFRDAVTRIAVCRMKDGTAQALCGIHVSGGVGKMLIEATDGKVMGRLFLNAPVYHSLDVILPGEIVQAMSGLPDGDMTIRATEGMISLSSGNVTVLSKLIDGTYPDVARAISIQKANLGASSAFDSAYLASAVKAASVSQTWDADRVGIFVGEDGAFAMGKGGAGEEIVIPVDCEAGDPFEVYVMPAYLLAMLSAAKRETLNLSSSGDALCCLDDGSDFQGLVMSLRVAKTMREAA